MNARCICTAAQSSIKLGELADEQIEPAVVVVVEPDSARTPSSGGNTCFGSHVSKGPVAVVVIEDVAAILRNINIR